MLKKDEINTILGAKTKLRENALLCAIKFILSFYIFMLHIKWRGPAQYLVLAVFGVPLFVWLISTCLDALAVLTG